MFFIVSTIGDVIHLNDDDVIMSSLLMKYPDFMILVTNLYPVRVMNNLQVKEKKIV